MKKKICAVLLSLCSLIGGAERKSDASIVGKVLKYGSATVGSLDVIYTIFKAWTNFKVRVSKGTIEYWEKNLADSSDSDRCFVGNYLNSLKNGTSDPMKKYVYLLTLLSEILCYCASYKLGQYLDKDSEKEKGKSRSGGDNSNNGVGSNNPKDVKA